MNQCYMYGIKFSGQFRLSDGDLFTLTIVTLLFLRFLLYICITVEWEHFEHCFV